MRRVRQLDFTDFQLAAAPKAVPEKPIPQRLETSLQIIASRQRVEVLATRGSHWKATWDKWKFRVNELMKPLAIPATVTAAVQPSAVWHLCFHYQHDHQAGRL